MWPLKQNVVANARIELTTHEDGRNKHKGIVIIMIANAFRGI